MSEIERVRRMVQDGRITEAEGQQLIEVLKGAEAADEELQAADRQIVAESRFEAPLPPAEQVSTTPQPVNSQAPQTPAAPARPAKPAAAGQAPAAPTPPSPVVPAPEGTRWVKLQMLAGDLTVNVDEAIEEPVAECDGPVDVIIERSGNGFNVKWDVPDMSFLEKMLGRIKSGNLSLTLPKGLGLDLNTTAGNVELNHVPYLRGSMTAGNLEARGLKGIDFTGRAGDYQVELDLTSGAHRMNVTAGNIKLKLAPTSSVAINATSSIGDITNRIPSIKKRSRMLGEELSGSLGTGQAKLEVSVTTGSVTLEVGNG